MQGLSTRLDRANAGQDGAEFLSLPCRYTTVLCVPLAVDPFQFYAWVTELCVLCSELKREVLVHNVSLRQGFYVCDDFIGSKFEFDSRAQTVRWRNPHYVEQAASLH